MLIYFFPTRVVFPQVQNYYDLRFCRSHPLYTVLVRRYNEHFRSKYTDELRTATNCPECDVRVNSISAGSVLIDTSVFYPASGPPPDARMASEVAQDLASNPASLFSAKFLMEFGNPNPATLLSSVGGSVVKPDDESGGLPEEGEEQEGEDFEEEAEEYVDDYQYEDYEGYIYYDDGYADFFADEPVEEIKTSSLNHSWPTEWMERMDGSVESITVRSGSLFMASAGLVAFHRFAACFSWRPRLCI